MNLIDIPSSIDMLFDKVLTIFLIAIGSFHTTSLIACIMNITAVSEIFHFTWSTKGFGTSTWFNQGFIVLNSHSVRLGTIECGGCRECDDKEDEEHHAESDRGLSCLRAVALLKGESPATVCYYWGLLKLLLLHLLGSASAMVRTRGKLAVDFLWRNWIQVDIALTTKLTSVYAYTAAFSIYKIIQNSMCTQYTIYSTVQKLSISAAVRTYLATVISKCCESSRYGRSYSSAEIWTERILKES